MDISFIANFFLHLDDYLTIIFSTLGIWTYFLLFFVIFAETGLIVFPFLPGDSLLFAIGAFAALGYLDLTIILISLFIAAIIGDSVNYTVGKYFGQKIVDNPTLFPDPQGIQEIREPVVNVYIMVPGEYIGDMMQLVLEKRGEVTNTETIDDMRVMLSCVLPLSEILVDFNDKLKSMTRGYGSMDYEHSGYRPAKMVKMDMLIAGDPVEAFSTIVHRDKAESYGRMLAGKLKEVIPSHLFVVAIQAAVGGKIVARESISAMRKNVTAKCYGGDITRKRKLLEKQKEGKKKMKMFGKVNIPQDAFIKVLKSGD